MPMRGKSLAGCAAPETRAVLDRQILRPASRQVKDLPRISMAEPSGKVSVGYQIRVRNLVCSTHDYMPK
jgi:hypothetical protein